ncbi:histidine--tRNA ligase [Roseiterribacter gracilis]|uniref:Histidine--tRNA ligase n=1 Tax=Roseiterribacter gracilis TaxID=2812848 RepID=A0A8S8X9Y8_9PROT|nr:histidine--tRNA ligase [Rhodospirillales bacterium TMPK1]
MSHPYRPRPISGFPELLPEVRLVEQAYLDKIRRTFERHGFASIETPSVEELDVLLAKGETDKEIYVLERLQADDASAKDARLGLHYDLTVPFARYVAQHFNELTFPFKRYQMQRVWRGERPQEGRYREFQQCDVDVIGVDNLALSFDADIPAVAMEAIKSLGVDDVRLHVSNRKILDGYLQVLGIEDRVTAIRWLDKLDKLGNVPVVAGLAAAGIEFEAAAAAVALAAIPVGDPAWADKARKLAAQSNTTFDTGVEELTTVLDTLAALGIDNVAADLSLARGFDYYTGSVYEGRFINYPGYGSVVAGGRYDDLAGSFINKKLPGVGISLGFSRLFAKLQAEGRLPIGPSTPTQVLVALPSDERRALALATAKQLRDRGLNVEIYHAPQKLARQLTYAEKKGIPFVWFPPFDDDGKHEVKDMGAKTQSEADPRTWNLPA